MSAKFPPSVAIQTTGKWIADKATCDVLTLLLYTVLWKTGYTGDITTDAKTCSNLLLTQKRGRLFLISNDKAKGTRKIRSGMQ